MIVWNSNFFAYICDCITIVSFMKNTDNQTVKYLFSVIVITFFAFGVYAQRVNVDMLITYNGNPEPLCWGRIFCDNNDSSFFAEGDTTGHIKLSLPRGRCVFRMFTYKSIQLDLQSDTTLEIEVEHGYGGDMYVSRREKDSVLRAYEAKLMADRNGWDSTRWNRKYVSLANLCLEDLYYPLPRWRTFSLDEMLKHIKYCYFKDTRKYDYLYYAICQLEHRLGLRHDRRVREPRRYINPDGSFFCLMPEIKEGWIEDTNTCYSCIIRDARSHSDILRREFAPQGERSLVYPPSTKPAVRMLIYGGLGYPIAYRIEDGRFYYCYSAHPIGKNAYERWDAELTEDELETFARCMDTLRMAGNRRVLNVSYVIDARTIDFEYTDENGYHIHECDIPPNSPYTAPIYRFFDTLYERHICELSIPVYDAIDSTEVDDGRIIVTGHNYRRISGTPSYLESAKFYLTKGEYKVCVECPGYKSYEKKVNVTGNLALDTIWLQHERTTLRLKLYSDDCNPITGKVALYVDGVDTAILSEVNPRNSKVVYRNVPAASHFYLVALKKYPGGWYHSRIINPKHFEKDFIKMHLDYSRQPFRSRAEKDSVLRSNVISWKASAIWKGEHIAKLYYYDALLKSMPLWQTFPDADSLAYYDLIRAYSHDTLAAYLYYPVKHLAKWCWRRHLKNENAVKKPVMDSLLQVLMPDELREEYHLYYGAQDYLTPYSEVWEAYDRNRQIFVPMQEPALLDSNASRLTIKKPNSVEVFRIANDTLYIKSMNGSWKLPEFHWSVIFEPSPDSGVETQKIAITKADFDTILGMVKMIDTLTCRYKVKDAEDNTYFIEYNIEGRCHSSKKIFNLLGTDMKPVYNLVSFLEKKKRK